MKILTSLAALLTASQALANPVFEDRSDALMPHQYTGDWEHFVGGGVAILDCNGDDLPDLFAAGGDTPARLMVNTGDFTFRDGGAFAVGATGAYPIDIDSDGILDLAVMRVGSNQLLKGDGMCGFTDASELWGFDGGDRWTTAFTATWQDDAWTLVFGNYVDRDDPDGPFGACDAHQVHRWTGAGFESSRLEPGYCTLSMLISDWQRSGTPTLRISNDRHYHKDEGYEQMLALDTLTLLPNWPDVKLWGMGIASGDVTGDGLPEVMLSSMGDQLLQINEATGFRDAAYETGTFATRPHVGDDAKPSTGWHTEFADVDNDGLLDLFIAKGNVEDMPMAAAMDPNNLLRQKLDGTFEEVSEAAGTASMGKSRGAGFADFDRDGRLDLVVVNRGGPMELYRNVTDGSGAWVAVTPSQNGANPFAVGAWVELQQDGRIQAREVTVGGGHASGRAGAVHFGLGAGQGARARVIWPDGTAGAWRAITPNTGVTIKRPSTP